MVCNAVHSRRCLCKYLGNGHHWQHHMLEGRIYGELGEECKLSEKERGLVGVLRYLGRFVVFPLPPLPTISVVATVHSYTVTWCMVLSRKACMALTMAFVPVGFQCVFGH